jgi:hypothetical protein
MARKKSRKEYTLQFVIDGEEYFSYIIDSRTIRLTKNTNAAYKLKTLSKFEDKINNIIRGGVCEFRLASEVIATSNDYLKLTLDFRKDEIEQVKKKYFKLKSLLPDDNFFNRENFDDNKYNDLYYDISEFKKFVQRLPTKYQQYKRDEKRLNILIKKNYKFKKLEFNIIDASHNFRYSKLKKLMDND